jgi:WD40 repeat protein
MPLNRVRQIIEGPARVAGLKVEEGLIAAAAADAGSDDALPLLAFTLRELYDRYGSRRQGQAEAERQLLLAHYKELGDPAADLTPLENSVRKRADDVIAGINPTADELQALREAFVGPLVRVNDKGEYVRHPARLSDLPAKAQPILKQLTEARLIVTRDDDGQRTIEVAHEAMLRKWPRLRAWLDEEREFLIGKSRLENALADWEKASEADKPSALLQGLALNRASQWLLDHPHAISESEQYFIKKSEDRARAEHRRRGRNRIALVVGALLLVAGAGIFLMQVDAARRESEALQRGVDATRLAFQSGVFLRANDLANAVGTALKAEETLSTPETRSSLLQSLLALSPHLAASLSVGGLRPLLLAGVPGSEEMLIGGLGGTVESWNPRRQEPSRKIITFEPKEPGSSIKPALRALASVSDRNAMAILDDGRLISFDPHDRRELAKPATLADDTGKAAIGESLHVIVAASLSSSEVSAFSCATKGASEPRLECERTVIAAGYADAVAISERSGIAAVGLEEGGLRLVKLDQPSAEGQKIDLPGNPRIGSLSFDRSGERLAVGTIAGQIFVVDLQGNYVSLPAQASNVTALAFDPASSRLATSCDDFAVCIWKLPRALGDREGAQLLVKLVGHTNTVLALGFGPGTDRVVSIGVDDAIKAWTIEAVDHISFALPAPNKAGLTDLDVSFDRRWLAAGNLEGGIDLWDLKSLAFVRTLPPLRAAEIRSLRWHPSELVIAQTDKVGWLAIRPLQDGLQPNQIKIDSNGNTADVVRWLPGGSSVAAGLFGGEIKEWKVGGEPVVFDARHPDAVQGLAVDPRTDRLYSSDSFGNLWAWAIRTREKLVEFPSSGEAADNVDLTKDGRTALTAGNGINLFLYDLQAASIYRQLEVGAQSEGAAFSPDGKQIAAVDIEGKLHIWLFPADEVFASVKVYPNELSGQEPGTTHLDRVVWLPELSAIAISTSRGEVKIVSYAVSAWRKRAKSVFLWK